MKTSVQVSLDTGVIKVLTELEIEMILRGADELIGVGGRNMLAKILKGSKDKKVLEHLWMNAQHMVFTSR